MMQPRPLRRVLCIRPRGNPHANALMTATADEWVEALKLHCDVVVVNQDFDLESHCDQRRPDLIVVEALEWARPWPLVIAGARSHPEIPRILYLNSDPHDPMRCVTMQVAEQLGVEAVFTTAESYLQHMPELRHIPHFFAPAFFDDAIYKDYGLAKSIPLSVFGGYLAPGFYPWRTRTLDAVRHVIPTLIYKHPGYVKGQIDPFAVRDVPYAQMLNRSAFSAADTTRLDYVVRKHLEIPASGSVLVAPDSQALKTLGFRDLETCILGDGPALFEKITAVARDPRLYERIRLAGMAFVHERFTRRTWTRFLDWLECRLALRAGQQVRQADIYGPFTTASTAPGADARTTIDSAMTAALRTARTAILTGENLAGAEAGLVEAAGWLDHVAEPHLLLGLLALLGGEPSKAAHAIERRARAQAIQDPALATFDPVEIAWLLLIARLMGETAIEQALMGHASRIEHVSLRRTLWLLAGGGQSREAVAPDLLDRHPTDRLSVHWIGDESFTLWCDLVRRVVASGRVKDRPAAQLAQALAAA